MNRRTFMQTQQRAYVYGHVEYMNDEWVFFDDEDEAHTLAHIEEEVELFAYDQWIKGVLNLTFRALSTKIGRIFLSSCRMNL